MTQSTTPESSALYDIIPPPRAALTPSLGFWLLTVVFAVILTILVTKKRKNKVPSIQFLLTSLQREIKDADNNFIIQNAPRISRLLRRAGGDIYKKDLTSLSAVELESILIEEDDKNDVHLSPTNSELIRFLISLETLKYGRQTLTQGSDSTKLIHSLEQILTTLSKSRRAP
jgi:hypothetical protein